MAEDNFDIQKQLEGNSLALNAIAEVLNKMDAKLSREEEVVLAKEEEIQKAAERESLVADVSKSVFQMIKEAMDGDYTANDDGEEVDAPKPGTEEVQKPIEKEHTDEHMDLDLDEEEDEDDDMEKGMKYKNGEDIEKSLRQQIANLEKQLEDTDSRIEKAVKAESEARLRKMGFKEETGLKAPVGVDEAPYISKSNAPVNSEDVVEQLASLSFKQLRDMQEKIEAGDTNGIPRELLGE
jgi:hypothetical protein